MRMARCSLKLVPVLLLLTVAHNKHAVEAIGENPMDINAIAGIIGGIGNMLQHNVETVDVPSSAIMGRWFQMYKAAVNFDVFRTQMFCPVAYFKPNSVMGSDGFSIEESYRVVSKNGAVETYKRDLNKVGAGQYWMYTEEYFYPRQFYLIKAGPGNVTRENATATATTAPKNNTTTSVNVTSKTTSNTTTTTNYEYIIVTDGSRLALMVFARDPLTFYQRHNDEVQAFLERSGFGGNVFWNSPRPIYQGADCEWPSEKEVFARRVLKSAARAKSAAAGGSADGGSGTGGVGGDMVSMIANPRAALAKLVQGQ